MSAILWVAAGETIETLDVIGRVEKTFVMSHCGHETRAYHCVNCQQPLFNIGQAIMHAEAPGEHRLVTFCGRHRVYEPAATSQIDAFAGVGPVQ